MAGKEAIQTIKDYKIDTTNDCYFVDDEVPLLAIFPREIITIENELELLTKYKRAFEILKPIINIDNNIEEGGKEYWLSDIWGLRKLTKEEYELLEELMDNENTK